MYVLREKTDALVGKAIPWLNKHTQNSDKKRQEQRCEAKQTAEPRLEEPPCQRTAGLDKQRNSKPISTQDRQAGVKACHPEEHFRVKMGAVVSCSRDMRVTRVRGSCCKAVAMNPKDRIPHQRGGEKGDGVDGF